MLILKHVDFLSVDAMERLPEQVSKSDASSFEFGSLDECLIRITKEMNVRDTCATFCLPTAYLFKVTPRMRRRVVQVMLVRKNVRPNEKHTLLSVGFPKVSGVY